MVVIHERAHPAWVTSISAHLNRYHSHSRSPPSYHPGPRHHPQPWVQTPLSAGYSLTPCSEDLPIQPLFVWIYCVSFFLFNLPASAPLRHSTLWRENRKKMGEKKKRKKKHAYRGSAPASSSNSTIEEPDSHSWRESLLQKRTDLCKGVSASRRSMGSTSRPSWSRRRSRTSSVEFLSQNVK